MIIDQRYDSELHRGVPEDPGRCLLVWPRKNAFTVFDGQLAHGVLDSSCSQSRVTMLINWWTSKPKACSHPSICSGLSSDSQRSSVELRNLMCQQGIKEPPSHLEPACRKPNCGSLKGSLGNGEVSRGAREASAASHINAQSHCAQSSALVLLEDPAQQQEACEGSEGRSRQMQQNMGLGMDQLHIGDHAEAIEAPIAAISVQSSCHGQEVITVSARSYRTMHCTPFLTVE